MADITRTITITVPDAYTARAIAWLKAQSALMVDSGEVDETGDPIMVPVEETVAQKFDRIAKAILLHQLKSRVLAFEKRLAEQSVTEISVT